MFIRLLTNPKISITAGLQTVFLKRILPNGQTKVLCYLHVVWSLSSPKTTVSKLLLFRKLSKWFLTIIKFRK